MANVLVRIGDKSLAAIQTLIVPVRGVPVMLDRDLASLYGVDVKRLNEQVTRNIEHFPERFMHQLTQEEFANLKSQFATSSWGSIRKPPRFFTEKGLYMLATILKGRQVGQKTVEVGQKTAELGQKANFQLLASAGRKDFRAKCERVWLCLEKDSKMSRRRISQELGIAESTVQCATNALQEVGLLRREGLGKGVKWIVVPFPSQPITKCAEPTTKGLKGITKLRKVRTKRSDSMQKGTRK